MIIGRKEEQKILHSAAQSENSEFIAVYGRRCVGKTHLIRETFGYKLHFSIPVWQRVIPESNYLVLPSHCVMLAMMIALYLNRG